MWQAAAALHTMKPGVAAVQPVGKLMAMVRGSAIASLRPSFFYEGEGRLLPAGFVCSGEKGRACYRRTSPKKEASNQRRQLARDR